MRFYMTLLNLKLCTWTTHASSGRRGPWSVFAAWCRHGRRKWRRRVPRRDHFIRSEYWEARHQN